MYIIKPVLKWTTSAYIKAQNNKMAGDIVVKKNHVLLGSKLAPVR